MELVYHISHIYVKSPPQGWHRLGVSLSLETYKFHIGSLFGRPSASMISPEKPLRGGLSAGVSSRAHTTCFGPSLGVVHPINCTTSGGFSKVGIADFLCPHWYTKTGLDTPDSISHTGKSVRPAPTVTRMTLPQRGRATGKNLGSERPPSPAVRPVTELFEVPALQRHPGMCRTDSGPSSLRGRRRCDNKMVSDGFEHLGG